jgi:hypothetical protein
VPYVNAPVPGTAGAPATGWTVTLFSAVSGTGTVYVICVAP